MAITLEQFCIDNNCNIIDLWDYDLNEVSPSEISHMSTDKVWLKCPNGKHESTLVSLNNVIKAFKNGKEYNYCRKCNSIGQLIVDKYGEEYLLKIWSDKNDKSPFDISKSSMEKIWLRCQNDSTHPDYDLSAFNFVNSHNCPYCVGKRVCLTNSLGYNYPKVLDIWSEKNDKTPFDYTTNSHTEVWWKCENHLHDDYKRMISRSNTYDFRCPVCGKANQYIPRGENHPNWKGGLTSEAQLQRKSPEYQKWRDLVYEKDDYTCQCCGQRGGRLTAHHLLDFASYPDLRFAVDNGITMCFDCHDATVKGSFHNLYGTHYKTASELEEYINNKREQLGIDIPFSIDGYKNGEKLTHDMVSNIFGDYEDKCENIIEEANSVNDKLTIKPKYRIKEE